MTFPDPPTDDNDELWSYVRQLERKLKNLETRELREMITKTKTPKPAKPPTFGGKTGESIDTWIFHIEQYFKLVILENDKRILFAASYLTENAVTWWRYTYMENARQKAVWNWEDFVENIRSQFRPISAEKTARNKLNNL